MVAPILGALTLPDQLIWVDRYAYLPVAAQVERTIGGGVAIFNQATSNGRTITLEARDGVEWFTQAQVNSLISMGSVAGAVYVFIYDSESMNVQFDHSAPPAAEFIPLWPFDDNYTGTIKLITV